MANETITQLPIALSVNGSTDYIELAQFTGPPGSLYTSKRVLAGQVAKTFVNAIPTGIEYIVYNQGNALVPGVQPYVTMPYAATITAATLLASPVGSVSVDIWRCSYAQYDGGLTHPVSADSITGGNPLTISSGTKAQSSLSGWSVSLNQGDIVEFSISSVSAVTKLTVALFLNRAVI